MTVGGHRDRDDGDDGDGLAPVTGTGIEVLALAALVLGVTIRSLRPQAASHESPWIFPPLMDESKWMDQGRVNHGEFLFESFAMIRILGVSDLTGHQTTSERCWCSNAQGP